MSDSIPFMSRPTKPPTESLRLSKTLTKKARIVAAMRDVSMPDYLAEILTPIVDRDFQAVIESASKSELSAPATEKPKKRGAAS